MATYEMASDSDHFVMLDLLNNENENGITKKYPAVQIVDQLDKIVHQNIETVRTRVGNALKPEEIKDDLLRITLNVDVDYKIQLFR